MPIYKNFDKKILVKSMREDISQIRDVEELEYYKNYVFYINFNDLEISVREHVWSHGDKLYKLAQTYFGNRDFFWLIGLLNNKPTDAHYTYGDIVFIPTDFMAFYRSVVK